MAKSSVDIALQRVSRSAPAPKAAAATPSEEQRIPAPEQQKNEGSVASPKKKSQQANPSSESAGNPRLSRDSLLSCLLRLTQEHGRPLSDNELRASCPIPETGMGVESFCRAAYLIGYKARSVPLGGNRITEFPAPFVILGDNGKRARLVLSTQGNVLIVYDPLTNSTYPLAVDEATRDASQVLLVKQTAIRSGHRKQTKKNWQALVKERVKRVWWELFLASLVINMFALASPLFVMTVYNKVIGQQALSTLHVLAIGMVAVYGFDLLLRVLRGYISSHTGARVDALIGSEVVHHLLRLPYSYYEATPAGVINERFHQLDTIRKFFCGPMPVAAVDLAFVFLFLGALYWIQPALAGIAFAAMPCFLLLSFAMQSRQKELIEQNFMALSAKSSALLETMNNALTIKSLGLEGEIEKRWGDRLALSAWTSLKAGSAANIVNAVSSGLQQVVSLAIIYFGAIYVTSGEISIGALIASSLLATRAIAPMRQVVSTWQQFQEVRSAFRRIDDIMDEDVEYQPGDLSALPTLKGKIDIENLTFGYDAARAPVIDNVSLSIESDSIVSVIGPSGSGKSTFAKLLQGLYLPQSGRILIDDHDINHISPGGLRRQMGVVPQETQLFAGTVRENIAMGLSLDKPEQVIKVAKFVGAHEFIQRLPQGYDTVLNERGGGISAGQRQLLTIARALLRNPHILILDEATSALDVATEEHFLSNLKRVSTGHTVILISHRLQSAAIADKVAFLVDGKLVRFGPPKDVIDFAKSFMVDRARKFAQ